MGCHEEGKSSAYSLNVLSNFLPLSCFFVLGGGCFTLHKLFSCLSLILKMSPILCQKFCSLHGWILSHIGSNRNWDSGKGSSFTVTMKAHCVAVQWLYFGSPDGMFTAQERRYLLHLSGGRSLSSYPVSWLCCNYLGAFLSWTWQNA